MLGLGIEQPAVGAAQTIGLQRTLQGTGLQKHGKAGQGAFGDRRRGERGERRPHMLLGFGADGHAFAGEHRGHPLGGPGPFGGIIECRERLQRDGRERVLRQRAAEVVPIPAHGERRGPDRPPEIEGEDLGLGIASKLQRHQRQQHAFASAGRSDHESVPDVADMQREPERGRAFGPGEEERGCTEMLVAFRSRPHGRERHHVSEVEGRDWWLADIGVDMAGKAPEPSFDRVDRLRDAGEVAALDDLFDQAAASRRRLLAPRPKP